MRNFALYAAILTAVVFIWLITFEIKSVEKWDFEDIFFESLISVGFITLFVSFMKRFENPMINVSFFMVVLSSTMDVLDEFTKEPHFFDTTLQGFLLVFGLLGLSWALKEEFSKLERTAFIDPLTGLFNRTYFEKWKSSDARKLQIPYGVLVTDMDNLKMLNDKYSHVAGDMALKTVASALRESLRKEDLAFRFGGDEFVAVLNGVDEKDVEDIVKRFVRRLKISSAYLKFPVEISCGYSIASPSKTFEEVFKEADEKMLENKRKKKRRVVD